jgi:hypothetical protein
MFEKTSTRIKIIKGLINNGIISNLIHYDKERAKVMFHLRPVYVNKDKQKVNKYLSLSEQLYVKVINIIEPIYYIPVIG